MKKVFLATFALLALSAMQMSAAFINGSFSIGHPQQVTTTGSTPNFGLDFSGFTGGSGNGDFAGLNSTITGNIQDIAPGNPSNSTFPVWFSFALGGTTFSFSLDNITEYTNIGGSISVRGSGIVSSSDVNLTPNLYNFLLTTQDSRTLNLSQTWSMTGTTVPEPGTYALIGSALLGLGLLRRRKA